MKHFLLILVLIFAPLSATAQTITSITEGDEAPFSGILLDARAFAELQTKAEMSEERISLEVETKLELRTTELNMEIELLKSDLQHERELRQIEKTQNNIDVQYWKSLYTDESNTSFFERNKVEIGFLSGVLVTVLVFITVDSLDDKIIEQQ
jgi:hypothetical protein